MAKNKASVGMELIDGDQLLASLKQIGIMVQNKVVDKALSAGIKPVAAALKVNAPDSQKTGSRKKQSRSTRAKWSNSRSLKTTIRYVVRKYDRGGLALAGPSYTHGGGHGNFFASDHKRAVYW